MNAMHIHFVCEGNTYRSRIAEAYGNAHIASGHRISSSGVRATDNMNGPITWIAAFIIKRHGLVPFMKNGSWDATDDTALRRADVIVFMGKEEYAAALERFHYDADNHEVWDIPDLDDHELAERDGEGASRTVATAEHTFTAICTQVDALFAHYGIGGR